MLGGFVLFGVYWPGLQGQFFFDDLPNILAVEAIRLTSLSLQSLGDVLGEQQCRAAWAAGCPADLWSQLLFQRP